MLLWSCAFGADVANLLQGGAGVQPHAGASSFAGPATTAATSSAGFLSQQQQLLARQLTQPTGLPLTRLTPLQSQQVTAVVTLLCGLQFVLSNPVVLHSLYR
jgi:hypothetical protein